MRLSQEKRKRGNKVGDYFLKSWIHYMMADNGLSYLLFKEDKTGSRIVERNSVSLNVLLSQAKEISPKSVGSSYYELPLASQ